MGEIKIRNISETDKKRLTLLYLEQGYENLNQFMIDQIQTILTNEVNNHYQNKFVDDLVEMKLKQNQILDKLNDQDVRNVALLKQLKVTEDLVETWIRFLEETAYHDLN